MASQNLGFFLGGVRDQANKAAELGLRESQLELQNRQLMTTTITDQLNTLNEQAAKIKESGSWTPEVEKFFREAAALGDKNAKAAGVNVSFTGSLERTIAGTLTPEEQTQKEIADKQAKQAAGVEPPAEATPQIVKLQAQRDAAIRRGDLADAQQIQDQIDKLGTVVGLTAEDVASREGAKAGAKAAASAGEQVRALSGNIEELELTLQQFIAEPLAGGGIGAILDATAGIAGQLDILLNTNLEDLLPGDQEKITEARTSAQFAVALMLSTITGEESGRFTKAEQELTRATLRTLNESSSPGQIKTAFDTALRILGRSQRRFAETLFAESGLDLSNGDDIDAAHALLMKNGMTSDAADDLLISIMKRRI